MVEYISQRPHEHRCASAYCVPRTGSSGGEHCCSASGRLRRASAYSVCCTSSIGENIAPAPAVSYAGAAPAVHAAPAPVANTSLQRQRRITQHPCRSTPVQYAAPGINLNKVDIPAVLLQSQGRIAAPTLDMMTRPTAFFTPRLESIR